MLLIINSYFLMGLLFGIYFTVRGYRRLDASANGAGILVRLMWLPAAIVLWPVLLKKTFFPGHDAGSVADENGEATQ
ncbi:MAG: hypothetical protein AAF431_06285 [Pseudomonadota bacterium]